MIVKIERKLKRILRGGEGGRRQPFKDCVFTAEGNNVSDSISESELLSE